MAKKTTLEIDQQNAEEDKAQCKKTLQEFTNLDIEAFQQWGVTQLKQYQMTLLTINQDEKNMQNSLQEKIKQKENIKNIAKNSIEKKIVSFTKTFAEESLELDLNSSIDDIGNYLKLKDKIEEDNLPSYKKEFKELINDKIISFISIFQNTLNKREEEIKEAIDKLNNSLKRIDYTDSTYIELRYEKSRDREIRDFRDSLKTCLGDAARYSAEDNEERFQNIKTLLIERFKNQERWTELVTDVRNWLDFSVIERYRSDNVEKEHHTDSSGKSGGQKAKLAYTILASAIAYQFGLNQDDEKYKFFRFVVINEIFSKLDHENALYVMELFKNLHLQLLLVTPKDKISLIESYISSLYLVSIIPDKDESRIIPISIEDYRNNRQILMNSSYD